MTFPTIRIPGMVAEDQLDMIESICSEIASQPWFVDDEDRKREFVGRVVFIFSRGMVERERLRSYAMVLAKARYERSDGSKQRINNVIKFNRLVQ